MKISWTIDQVCVHSPEIALVAVDVVVDVEVVSILRKRTLFITIKLSLKTNDQLKKAFLYRHVTNELHEYFQGKEESNFYTFTY